MTTRTFHRTPARHERLTGRAGRLLRGLRSDATSATRHTVPAPAAGSPVLRGCLWLTLHDGVDRLYLLNHRDFATTTSPDVAYDARVHTAYVLTLQGHRPDQLAQHLNLPDAATRAIAEHAERSGPTGPATEPPTA
ncbi:hypothetical protein ACIRYZ_41045 [Kitasatospora sp. NPDC101155]|uniref:hypothetical protein n=1 Tax=Kitasatospora sp. NPDC101155 TaxID=3364097 RepID=UPI0038170421